MDFMSFQKYPRNQSVNLQSGIMLHEFFGVQNAPICMKLLKQDSQGM